MLLFGQHVKRNKSVKLAKEKTKLRDRVRVYRQHIKQPEYRILKVEQHLSTCDKNNLEIFPFFQLKTNNSFYREQYEKYFCERSRPSLH